MAPRPTTPRRSTTAGRRMTKLAQRVPRFGFSTAFSAGFSAAFFACFLRFSPVGRIFLPA